MSSERWALPQSWQWKALSEIGHVVSGGTPSTRDAANFAADGFPWITPADLSGYHNVYVSRGRRSLSDEGLARSGAMILPRDTVLFSSRAPIGYCALAANELVTSQGFKNLVLNPAMSPHYVRQYLLSSIDYAEAQASGTTFKELSAAKFGALRIPVAPPDEQVRIARRLNTLTELSSQGSAEITLARRMSITLRAAFFRQAFSGALTAGWRKGHRVEASEALLARLPDIEQAPGGRGATDRVVGGGIGLRVNGDATSLPSGWSWQPLRRLARQESGHTPSRSVPDYWDGGIPWVGVRDAASHHGQVINTTMQTISESGLENSSTRILPQDTILLCRTAGSIGHVCRLGKPMATSQDFVGWVCGPALLPAYLMYLLMGERDLLRRLGRGTTHPTIYFPEIRAFSIAVPPITEQSEIVRLLDLHFAALDAADHELNAASRLIQNLERRLRERAFRGQLEPVTEELGLVDATLTRHQSEFEMKKPKRLTLQQKAAATRPSIKHQLAARYDVWPSSGYSFEELRESLKGNYDEARTALFAALRAKELHQHFDERRRMIVFVRTKP